MITYKRCSDISIKDIVDAFNIGFSDYIIKLELTEELFLSRFIIVEQNQLEHSFIAYDKQLPIGLILGGIKTYDEIKTLRCGTLCVHPLYRKQSVASKLFNLHKEEALNHQCERLYLEVIQGNDKAITFYQKQGYRILNELVYYSHSDPQILSSELNNSLDIRKIEFDDVKNLHQDKVNKHLQWQNDFDYMGFFPQLINYGLYIDDKLVGALSALPSGKAFYLWIQENYRQKGYSKALLGKLVKDHNISKLMMSFIPDETISNPLIKLGFTKDKISQFEMVQVLS